EIGEDSRAGVSPAIEAPRRLGRRDACPTSWPISRRDACATTCLTGRRDACATWLLVVGQASRLPGLDKSPNADEHYEHAGVFSRSGGAAEGFWNAGRLTDPAPVLTAIGSIHAITVET